MSDLPAVIERSLPPAVIDAEYREIRPYRGPVQRSVVLPAGLLAAAICGTPCLIFAALIWGAGGRP